MGILSKLMFWKREEPFPEPKELGAGPELGLPGEEALGLPKPGEMPGMPPGEGELGLPKPEEAPPGRPEFAAPRLEEAGAEPAPPAYGPPGPGPSPAAPAPPVGRPLSNKDLEIISLKLDSLKTTLEAINERIARLEKIAEGGGGRFERF